MPTFIIRVGVGHFECPLNRLAQISNRADEDMSGLVGGRF
jgi:hypothetical protein